jgi:hypothetical protein
VTYRSIRVLLISPQEIARENARRREAERDALEKVETRNREIRRKEAEDRERYGLGVPPFDDLDYSSTCEKDFYKKL